MSRLWRRLGRIEMSDKPRTLLRWSEVCLRIPISRSHAHALVAQGKFPRPVKLVAGGRSSGWFEDEIDEYISKLDGG